MDEAAIEKQAEAELLQEAQRGAARASMHGPTGWQRCPLPKTNKRFLHNTILHSLQANLRVRNEENVSQTKHSVPSQIETSKISPEKRKYDAKPGKLVAKKDSEESTASASVSRDKSSSAKRKEKSKHDSKKTKT